MRFASKTVATSKRPFRSSGADAEHGYSGDYSRKNDALQWNKFQYRNYDSRLGRLLIKNSSVKVGVIIIK
ncbi:MAG: hypothetical protein CMI36_09725 [Owenweeksia sp.]|nr:hypothetical protein [Owenweeksia sp.]MBF99261.1 hypothetical protein [Owenweeksia sp.]HBF22097.1 hypothetical protein [Cryomorphaceae bacterium]HCQ15873.1 hypothetical protein [Cryomorphaceae bacterium]